MLKPFDPAVFAADDPVKHRVIELFRRWNCDLRVNADEYGVDLIGKDRATGDVFGVEVEVKHNWTGSFFPFTTVHYSARKLKFLDAFPQLHMATVNSEHTHVLILDVHTHDTARMVRKQTSVTASEWFIEFPVAGATIDRLP